MNSEELLAPIQHLLPKKEEMIPEIDVRDPVIPSDSLEGPLEVQAAAGDADQTPDTPSLEPEPEAHTDSTAPLSSTHTPSETSTEANFTVGTDTEDDVQNTSLENESKSLSQEPLLTDENVPSSESLPLPTQDTVLAKPSDTHTIS